MRAEPNEGVEELRIVSVMVIVTWPRQVVGLPALVYVDHSVVVLPGNVEV